MARILALDVGDKRIGVAVSDEGARIASPHSVYTRVGYGPDTRHIAALCASLQAELVVLGLPLNMDGSEGFQAAASRALGEQLQKAGLAVAYQDERLTTRMAHSALMEGGMRRDKRHGTVDQVAAALILETYLSAHFA